jgi:hypothetical protein
MGRFMKKQTKKIYLVTKGDYSEYHICSVWSTKERAEKNAKLIQGYVEEWEIDSSKKQQSVQYTFIFQKNGDIFLAGVTDYNQEKPDSDKKNDLYGYEDMPHNEDRDIMVSVWATSELKAEKIAIDMKTKYLAEKKGVI